MEVHSISVVWILQAVSVARAQVAASHVTTGGVHLWLRVRPQSPNPPALPAGMLTVCPESPRWLASTGRTAEAEAAARALWGPNGVEELQGGAAPPAAGGGREMRGAVLGHRKG